MTLRAQLADFVPPLHQARSAFVSDFDGTLAPIVDDPAKAEPLPEAIEALRTLASHLGLVGVVSGRPVEFLRAHIPIDGVVLIGQYGLERLVDGRVVLDPRTEAHVGAVARARSEAEQRWPTLLIERKGDIAFTVHWRTSPVDEPPPEELAGLATNYGLAIQPGKMACELRPPVPIDKGTAFSALVSGYAYTAFAGDDRGDLAAFTVELGDVEHDAQPVRIAVRSSEAPPELLEHADVIVDGPHGLAELLTELADAVSARPLP